MRPSWSTAAAATLVVVPIVIGLIVLFGGSQVNNCLGGTACERLPPPPPTLGLLGVDLVVPAVLALGIGWLVLAAVVVRHVWRRDGRRLRQAATVVLVIAGATGFAAAAVRFMEGMPRRTVAQDAALWAIGAVVVLLPPALAWAVATARGAKA